MISICASELWLGALKIKMRGSVFLSHISLKAQAIFCSHPGYIITPYSLSKGRNVSGTIVVLLSNMIIEYTKKNARLKLTGSNDKHYTNTSQTSVTIVSCLQGPRPIYEFIQLKAEMVLNLNRANIDLSRGISGSTQVGPLFLGRRLYFYH